MDKGYRMVEGKLTLVELDGCATCGNTSGTFKIIGDKRYCVRKCQREGLRDSAKTTFPFTTNHLDGKPTEVQSLRHLRKLEAAHGVQSAAYNMDSQNLDR